ncbi:MAG: hypothetical protein HDQ91_03690 [Desulfovibrio sp.]|nr:hypothetical protein [Desulfovibrio sp.]
MSRKLNLLGEVLGRYCAGNAPKIVFPEPQARKSERELLEEGRNKPELQLFQKILGAQISEYTEESGED